MSDAELDQIKLDQLAHWKLRYRTLFREAQDIRETLRKIARHTVSEAFKKIDPNWQRFEDPLSRDLPALEEEQRVTEYLLAEAEYQTVRLELEVQLSRPQTLLVSDAKRDLMRRYLVARLGVSEERSYSAIHFIVKMFGDEI